MDTILNILHVGTAVFIVGPMAILPMTGMAALRSGNAGQVRTLAKSTAIFTGLSLLTFIFGFGVMGMADPKFGLSFTTAWILWSIILYLIAFVLTMFVVVPQMNKAAKALVGTDSAGKPAGYGVIAATNGISALLLVVVVVLMIWKP